jgi:hypothetical protein
MRIVKDNVKKFVWTIKKITEIERMREISNHHQHGMED